MSGTGHGDRGQRACRDNRGEARGEEALFTDGPILESKEYIVGFWIIEAPDLDAALKLAAEGSKACNARVEVRPFLGK